MIYPSADRLEEKVGNKYALVIVSAKRARQLKEGAMPMCRVTSENPLSIAMDEVADAKVIAIAPPEPVEVIEKLPLPIDGAVLLSSLSADDLEFEDEELGVVDEAEEEEEAAAEKIEAEAEAEAEEEEAEAEGEAEESAGDEEADEE